MNPRHRTAEELLLDMRREAEDPWRYYHHYGRKPRKIMLPIRVTARARDAIRATAGFCNNGGQG